MEGERQTQEVLKGDSEKETLNVQNLTDVTLVTENHELSTETITVDNNRPGSKNDASVEKQPKPKRTKKALKLVFGVIMMMAFPIAWAVRFVFAIIISILFTLLSVAFPFLLPLVVPENGELEDAFGNIFNGVMADGEFSLVMNVGLGIITVVGVVLVITYFVSKQNEGGRPNQGVEQV